MPNITDTGFILRKIPYSESSLILKAYTREHGVVSFMAKGAKRQNSRLHGLLESALHLQFLFPAQSRGEMRILSDVALLRDFPAVHDDLVKHALAQALGEVLLKYMPDEARAPAFHDLLLSATVRLEEAPATRQALEARFAAYLLDFCRHSGFQPQFRFCIRCDARVLLPGAPLTGRNVAFETELGGALCGRCQAGEEGVSLRLKDGHLRWLDLLQDGAPPAGEAASDAEDVLPALGWREALQVEEFLLMYLGRHAGGQKPLKSVSVWRALMDG